MIKRPISCVSSFAAGGNVEDLGSAAYKDAGNSSGQLPILDSNGKLNANTIPSVAITDVFTANSDQEMTALSAEKGDVCIRPDKNTTYVLMSSPSITLSNWVQISNTMSVTSVNSKTGIVTLYPDDVGAVSKNSEIIGSTKCKITYDSKGLVTSGNDLDASDLPSHKHSTSDINSGILPIDKGGTSSNNKTDAIVNLGLSSKTEETFSGTNESDYLNNVQLYFVNNNNNCVPFTYNADWTGNGDGVAIGIATKSTSISRYLFSFNENIGVKFYHQNNSDNFAWRDFSWTGKSIYSNDSGTNGTVNFNSGYTSSQFKYLRILYYTRISESILAKSDVLVSASNTKKINLKGINRSNLANRIYIMTKIITINDSSLTVEPSYTGYMRYGSTTDGSVGTNDYIYITDVIGYKYI